MSERLILWDRFGVCVWNERLVLPRLATLSGDIPDFQLLRVTGAQYGPSLGDKLVRAKSIQRVNTAAGIAPAAGCSAATDVGKGVLVPYTADYVFCRE